MERGELYRVARPTGDPRSHRVFLIVSRNQLIASSHSTVVCAGVFSSYADLSTQVLVDESLGLKHLSSVHCDDLVGLPKRMLRDYIGQLSAAKMREVNRALAVALAISSDDIDDD